MKTQADLSLYAPADYGFNFSGLTGTVTWRFPILMQSFFILGIFLIAAIIPDTPRWYLARGRDDEALAVLARLADKPQDDEWVQDQYSSIKQTIAHENEAAKQSNTFLALLSPGGKGRDDAVRTRRRLLLACFIQAAQQWGGINA